MKKLPAIYCMVFSLAAFARANAAPGTGADVHEAQAVYELNQVVGAIWPGYRINKPVLIYFKDIERSVLIAHPAPPKDFSPCVGGSKSLYCRQGKYNGVRSDFSISYKLNGVDTVFYTLRDIYSPGQGRDLLFHENFHEFQGTHFRGSQQYFKTYQPEPEAEVYFRMENKALLNAFLANGKEKIRYAGDFVALRNQEKKLISKADRAREEYKERIEGSAEYVGLMSVAWPGKGGHGNAYARPRILRDSLFLSDIFSNGENFYFSGMLQMAILDSLRIPWQKRLQDGETIYTIFKDYFPGNGTGIRALKNKYGYNGLLSEVKLRSAADAAKNNASELAVFSKPAITVTVPVKTGAAGPQSHGEFRLLADGGTYYSTAKLEVPEKNGFFMFVNDLGMVMNRSASPVRTGRSIVYPNKYKVFVDDLSPVELYLDGAKAVLSTQEKTFESIKVEATGFTLKSICHGKAVRTGNELSIVFDNN